MEVRIMGIDLSDQGAGVSFSDTDQSFHVPAAICRDRKHDQWYVGEEAYEKALAGKGILTDRLFGMTCREGTATIRGVRYEGAELLCRFIAMVRDGCSASAGGPAVGCTVLVMPSYDRELNEKILQGLTAHGFDRKTTFCISRAESFLYYVMSQPREVRTAGVGLFDLSDQSLLFYELQMKRDKRKLYVRTDQEEMKEAFTLSVLDTPAGGKLADKIMLNCAERLFRKKVFSAILLTGKGFERYDWAENFMKKICQRRKVFLDLDIFSKGALVRGRGLLGGQGDPGFVALCSGRAAATVTMNVEKNGQKMVFPILNAGDPVDAAGVDLRLLPDGKSDLELMVDPVNIKKKQIIRIPFPMPKDREPKTSFMQLSVRFPDEGSMKVRLQDAGFGELFPPTEETVEREVRFWE